MYGIYPGYDYGKHKRVYGRNPDGSAIEMPKGWKLVPHGTEIPQRHREFIIDHTGQWVWCGQRYCRSTMTPIAARCWGHVMAFAVPEETDMSELLRFSEELMYD
jgi:hypothetical protein